MIRYNMIYRYRKRYIDIFDISNHHYYGYFSHLCLNAQLVAIVSRIDSLHLGSKYWMQEVAIFGQTTTVQTSNR